MSRSKLLSQEILFLSLSLSHFFSSCSLYATRGFVQLGNRLSVYSSSFAAETHDTPFRAPHIMKDDAFYSRGPRLFRGHTSSKLNSPVLSISTDFSKRMVYLSEASPPWPQRGGLSVIARQVFSRPFNFRFLRFSLSALFISFLCIYVLLFLIRYKRQLLMQWNVFSLWRTYCFRE